MKLFHIVEDGQRALMIRPDGRTEAIVGPARVLAWNRRFQVMRSLVAHPGEFLVVRHVDGRVDHQAGPVRIWLDPRDHASIGKEEALQIAAKEAVVVYGHHDSDGMSRRIVNGPASFIPDPGEWLHTFSWHGAVGGSRGEPKVAKAHQFQKLRLMPDQMYHDVDGVRTGDDAVLTIKLMIFFELMDVEKMLDTTRDPIGDFINAATSDVVEFVGRFTFEAFKSSTDSLNDLERYGQLVSRAGQCGYRVNKVVYRGYSAAAVLQQMHDNAIESRTGLQLEKVTEEQAQELQDFKLERQLTRSAKQREEQERENDQEIRLHERREQAKLALRRAHTEQEAEITRQRDALRREFLGALRELGVELTEYLTQGRSDRVIEFRGSNWEGTQVHLGEETLGVPSRESRLDDRSVE